MTTLPGIDGHPHATAVLRAALSDGGSPSHAYLFHGPPGAGKRTVARAFAAALLAEGGPESASTGERVMRGAHPDLTWVTPSGAAEMLVSDIDEPVVAAATRTPFEASRRVFVIEGADRMNDQAANRMLKTLEEPASFVHLILLAERPGDVLPTISSRCQPVRFDAPPAQTIAARLCAEGADPAEADACARLALGDVQVARHLVTAQGRALRAASERIARAALAGEPDPRPWADLLEAARAAGAQAGQDVRERAESELELVPERERRRHLREAEDAVRRVERRRRTRAIDLGLRLAGLWLRDCACLADGAPELVHATDRAGDLAADASGRDATQLRRALELVEDTRASLTVNVSDELALDALTQRLASTLSRR